MTKALKEKIRQIPPPIEDTYWLYTSNEEAFCELAEILLDLHMSDDDIIEFLTSAYAAVAAEYGD